MVMSEIGESISITLVSLVIALKLQFILWRGRRGLKG